MTDQAIGAIHPVANKCVPVDLAVLFDLKGRIAVLVEILPVGVGYRRRVAGSVAVSRGGGGNEAARQQTGKQSPERHSYPPLRSLAAFLFSAGRGYRLNDRKLVERHKVATLGFNLR